MAMSGEGERRNKGKDKFKEKKKHPYKKGGRARTFEERMKVKRAMEKVRKGNKK